MLINNFVEVPFENRYQCWFCQEPAGCYFSFPHHLHLVLDCSHPSLAVPSCDECNAMALKAKVRDIWQVKQQVKSALIKKYKKDLAIGLNWTQEELQNSGFEDGCFAGFQKSAWFMYEVAKQRVNAKAWPLVLDGIALEQDSSVLSFQFDGVIYPSIEQAIEHYCDNFNLDKAYLRQVLAKIGNDKFSQAVRFCRLYIGATPDEKRQALNSF